MRILVTGGEGFIGKYVMSRGRELGYKMFSYDLADYDLTKHPTTQPPRQDVTSFETLYETFAEIRPQAVIHLAGLLGTHELWDSVDAAIETNIKGAYNVAELCMPYNYDAQLVCIEQPHIWYNVYEATKLAARRILTGMHYDQGLKVEFVRAHNAFGPGQHYGEGHPQKIIPTFSVKAWSGEPIPIWGTGMQNVNLVYAGDVAEALLTAATRSTNDVSHTWEAGSNELWSVQEVANYVKTYVQTKLYTTVTFTYKEMRKGEQKHLRYPTPDDTYPFIVDPVKLDATIDWYKQYADTK